MPTSVNAVTVASMAAAARPPTEEDAALVEWVRAKIRTMRAKEPKPMTWRKIGEEFGGLTHAWAQAIMNPAKYGEKGIGKDAEKSIARVFFGGSVDAFRAAATGKAAPAGSVETTDEGEEALKLFPRFRDYERYAQDHALAAWTLERVDGYPRPVAAALVHANRVPSFDESETPDIGLRAAQIAENARSNGALPKGTKTLKKMPKELPAKRPAR